MQLMSLIRVLRLRNSCCVFEPHSRAFDTRYRVSSHDYKAILVIKVTLTGEIPMVTRFDSFRKAVATSILAVIASQATHGQDAKSGVDIASLTASVKELRAEVAYLKDREAINDLYIRFIRGVDRVDEKLHNGAFWPDAQINGGGTVGDRTVGAMWKSHSTEFPNNALKSWAHLITNQTVEIDGDVAYVETYVTGMGIPKDKGENLNAIWGARYIDRLERRNGEWRIAVREMIPHFGLKGDTDSGWSADNDAYPYSCLHSKHDPSYVRPMTRWTDKQVKAPCAN